MLFRRVMVLLFIVGTAQAYQTGLATLRLPTFLERWRELELSFAHRFEGDLGGKGFVDVMGLDVGAIVLLGARYPVWDGILVEGEMVLRDREYRAGVSFSRTWGHTGGILGVYYATHDRTPFGLSADRVDYLVVIGGAQLVTFADRFSPAINVVFDGHTNRVGGGVGAYLTTFDFLHFMGEFYPNFHGGEDGGHVWLAGIELTTSGHQFHVYVGNGAQLSPRKLIAGGGDNKVRLGFVIRRWFAW